MPLAFSLQRGQTFTVGPTTYELHDCRPPHAIVLRRQSYPERQIDVPYGRVVEIDPGRTVEISDRGAFGHRNVRIAVGAPPDEKITRPPARL